MEDSVFIELNPMEIGDVMKSRPPKTGTLMENCTVKIGAFLKDSFTKRARTV